MVEVLAAVSGIAGLLSLTIEVCKISKVYIDGVHGASRSIVSIVAELKGLKQVLWELDELYAAEDPRDGNIPSLEHDTYGELSLIS